MTTTNQAFIKAYRQDVPQERLGRPAIAAAARPAAVEHTVAATAERSALYRPLSEKQPLSSFIGYAGDRPLADRTESDFLRPGTTVASFQWPIVCRAIAQQCGTQLDGVAELLIAQAAAGRSLIGVIGLHARQGATTTALCLAARLAGRGQRIILVDGNFTNPALASVMDAVPTCGWQDVLQHGTPLADALIRGTDDRLDVLALGPKATADALRLVSGLQAVVTAGVLRHAYDLVIVDAGAFSDPASQSIMLAMVRNMGFDAALAVTCPQPSETRAIGMLADQLGRSGCELLGTIENRVAKTQAA